MFGKTNGKGKDIFKDLDVKNLVWEKGKPVPDVMKNGHQMKKGKKFGDI